MCYRPSSRRAEDHLTWGYRWIQDALAHLGHPIDKLTVRHILRRHHLDPAPLHRKAGMRWTQGVQRHGEVLTATACCTVEVATWP